MLSNIARTRLFVRASPSFSSLSTPPTTKDTTTAKDEKHAITSHSSYVDNAIIHTRNDAPYIDRVHTSKGETVVEILSGAPREVLDKRPVYIYKPVKVATQSGTRKTHDWVIDFGNQERWVNPLMGYVSNGDPLSNTKLKFSSRESAIEFAEKHGYEWHVTESVENTAATTPKFYADKFKYRKPPVDVYDKY